MTTVSNKSKRTTSATDPFSSVVPLHRVDHPAMERQWLERWHSEGTIERYLHRNDASAERFSFIDGPITANNRMGVHHAWNRTYKDMYQRFQTMLGKRQRYQNGFDCQGLWVEVEVEREFGFKSKQDIETYGIGPFVDRCKERVNRFAELITDQSKRLGYWMHWDNSYFTMSEENNYTIWHFLKICNERGLIYKGRDAMPWCPRCATGISDMEINEGRKEVQHTSVYARFPLIGRKNEYLLVWTTTPWTLAANVACAVNPDLTYARVEQDGDVYYLCKDLVPKLEKLRGKTKGPYSVVSELRGADLVGWEYTGPFDDFAAWKTFEPQYARGVVEQGESRVHRIVPWKDVEANEGTGIVHIAPGCGREDFFLSKDEGLRFIAPVDESGIYYDGFGFLSGEYVGTVARPIFDALKERGAFYQTESIKHVYPHCWRCSTELIFRNVEEWFINMGPKDDPSRQGLRYEIMDVVKQIRWLPDFGLDRELDWLRNMEDWMISKKRYWGLALPIFECSACGHFDVIGSETELKERAVEGWDLFAGHTPHRPWVDAVKIACSQCGASSERIKDVGNPWLDAGIVPYATLAYRRDRDYWQEWFPAHFITESFPGQFRNWFYSMLVMSTVLENKPPFKTVLGFASVMAHDGSLMSKSKGTAIWFEDAVERVGADTMRWLYAAQPPEKDIWFAKIPTEEQMAEAAESGLPIRLNDQWLQVRGTLDKLWNVYYFFVTYANIDHFHPWDHTLPGEKRPEVDRWLLSELQETMSIVTECMQLFDSMTAVNAISDFVDQLSNWYIRRVRRRFWQNEMNTEKVAAYLTLYEALLTLTKLVAPIAPFLSEELYVSLIEHLPAGNTPSSVHLCDWPHAQESLVNADLRREVRLVQRVVNLGRSAREQAKIRVRQPLPAIYARVHDDDRQRLQHLADQILDELNVKELHFLEHGSDMLTASVKPKMAALGQKYRSQMQPILAALKSVSSEAAQDFREQERLPLTLATGDIVTLTSDDLDVFYSAREGFIAAEDHGLVVVLETILTPVLEEEGLIRDLTHYINSARKKGEFAIEEHIATILVTDAEFAALVERYRTEVCDETLSHTLALQHLPPVDLTAVVYSEEIPDARLGGHGVTLYLSRAEKVPVQSKNTSVSTSSKKSSSKKSSSKKAPTS